MLIRISRRGLLWDASCKWGCAWACPACTETVKVKVKWPQRRVECLKCLTCLKWLGWQGLTQRPSTRTPTRTESEMLQQKQLELQKPRPRTPSCCLTPCAWGRTPRSGVLLNNLQHFPDALGLALLTIKRRSTPGCAKPLSC